MEQSSPLVRAAALRRLSSAVYCSSSFGVLSLQMCHRPKLFPAIFDVAFNLVEREKGKESLEALQFLENEVKDKKFFGGDAVRWVGITALFVAFWLPKIQEAGGFVLFASEKLPNLHQWSQEIRNHPMVKGALPPREHLLAFFRARFGSLAASK